MLKKRLLPLAGLAIVAPLFAVGPSFIPDHTFTGSSLTGWHTVGQAEWRAENGEIIGKPTAESGGWLVLDRSYQDVALYAEFECSSGCQTGVLFRAEKTGSGMKGTFVDLSDPQLQGYAMTISADGKIDSRESRGGEAGSCAIRLRPTQMQSPSISISQRHRLICR